MTGVSKWGDIYRKSATAPGPGVEDGFRSRREPTLVGEGGEDRDRVAGPAGGGFSTVLRYEQFYRWEVRGVSLGIPGEDSHPLHRGMSSDIEIQ